MGIGPSRPSRSRSGSVDQASAASVADAVEAVIDHYDDIKSRWEANVITLQERAPYNSKQQALLPSVRCAEEVVTDANLADYLQAEKATNARNRLLFIPLQLKDRWLSVLLHIDKKVLVGAACIDSATDPSDVDQLLEEAIKTVYPDYQDHVLSFSGFSQQDVDRESSEVLAIQNGLSLLERAYQGGNFDIPSQVCDAKKRETFADSQQRAYEKYCERIAGLSPAVIDRLMESRVDISASDLAQLLRFSRGVNRSVMKVKSRVEALKTASRVTPTVVAGGRHSFLQSQTGEWFGCGWNQHGQLGLGHDRDQWTWTPLELPAGVEIDCVVVGEFHSFLRSKTGAWFGCGANRQGQLGLGHTEEQSTWTPLELPEGVEGDRVVAGEFHTFLRSQTGAWFGCGSNEFGQLGLGHTEEQWRWTPLKLPEGVEIDCVVVRGTHTFMRSQTGAWFGCGANRSGQLGLGDTDNRLEWTPVALPDGVEIDRVVAGGRHTFMRSQRGQWFGCGNNYYGELGLGHDRDQWTWTPLELPEGVEVGRVVAGCNRTFMRSQTGEWFGCGKNGFGQLGLGDRDDRLEWTSVALPEGVEIDCVVAGHEHSFLRTQAGEWYGCGVNRQVQLGLGDRRTKLTWTSLKLPAGVSMTEPSLLAQSCDAVDDYLASPSAEAVITLVSTLSKEQLLLVPYKMRSEQAEVLNQHAHQALQSVQGVSASAASSSPGLFSPSDYDSSINYCEKLKEKIPVSDCVDDNAAQCA